MKPPVEKPTLELAIIPLEESQWYTLGQALGLKEGLLKSIQHGTSNPTKRKREMFKIWLKKKDTKVSWHILLGALRKIGATDTAEVVRSEYGISDSSYSEEVSGGEDEVDARFSEVCLFKLVYSICLARDCAFSYQMAIKPKCTCNCEHMIHN